MVSLVMEIKQNGDTLQIKEEGKDAVCTYKKAK
jgi:hypothetical protein